MTGVADARLIFPTAIGACEVHWAGDALTGFRLPAEPAPATANTAAAGAFAAPDWVRRLIERVQAHLKGECQDFSTEPYAFDLVSAFQRSVYTAALKVPAGATRTYGWIAAQIAQPSSASRAVGVALGRNPWPLLVPCHRFVSSTGKMTGFSAPGGIRTKLLLLSIEGAELFPA